MRYTWAALFFCMLIFTKTSAQQVFCPPSNVGFENGTFNGWACDTGQVDALGVPVLIPSNAVANRQVMIDNNSYPDLDPWGNFPVLCPYGDKYSIRLGNQQTGRGAERVSYTFTVPPASDEYDLIFYYAVVLQNPPHLSYQQPRFTVKTFDVSDSTYIDCGSFDFIASASLPGFRPSAMGDTVFYKDWAPSTIHLRGYAGKQIRLEFTTNDCTLGRHFGYAYLDVNEDCGPLIGGNIYCTEQKSVSLTAPGGFGNYTWYNADMSRQLNEGQVYTISPPPPDGTQYAVIVTPYFGLGCTDTIYTTVNRNDGNFLFKAKDTIRACAGNTVNLTAAAVTAGSSGDLKLTYSTDMDGLNYLYEPQNISESGTYYIKAVSPKGCTGILPVEVIITNPELTVTDPPPVSFPVTVDISATFTHLPGIAYSYFTNPEATIAVVDFQHVAHSGTYYIRATNTTGCETTKPVNVEVTPPAPPVVTAVNAFTPNNDGVNDLFLVKITGYGVFKSLRIYNRYGQQVFETLSEGIAWDGKLNNNPLPPGTYYWIFNGTNTYYNTKVVESGYITLIR